MTARSAVQILEYPSGTRIPLFAELDHNVIDACKTAMDCHGGTTCQSGTSTPAASRETPVPTMMQTFSSTFRAAR